MNLRAGWEGTWQAFLQVEKPSFIQILTDFYNKLDWTTKLAPTQKFAWEVEYDLMQSTIKYVLAETGMKSDECWIAFEQELIGEGGKRAADVNLVTPSGELFVIEFKHKTVASEHEVLRTNFDLQTMLRYHEKSIGLKKGHAFLILTKPGAVEFEHPIVVCEIANENVAQKLRSYLVAALNEASCYDALDWTKGDFYRQPSILQGTVQVFFDAKIPTLKTSAGENIEEARSALLKLYQHARKKQQRYVVVVHGRPGAGKTLLGISSVAEIARKYSANQCHPIFLSGNGPLVQVLQYTLDYYGQKKTDHEQGNIIDGRIMIQNLYIFKKHIKNLLNSREETFVVFDEAQRAWSKSTPRDIKSPSELMLFCNWLSKQPYGVLVLLVGDGQAIHRNEMELDQMLTDLDNSIRSQNGNVVAIMPPLHASKMQKIKPIERDVFNLKVPIRQSYTEYLDQWIEAVLSNEPGTAIQVAENIQIHYPLRVTQDKDAAEKYSKELQKILHEGNKKSDVFRCGWLMSSQGGEFIEEVQKNKLKEGEFLGPWFVEPPNSENSCCQFKAACTEFSCQGLELSLALFNWGKDLLYRNGNLSISAGNYRAHAYYTEGSYRVLLSRGRNGLVIKCDDNETYKYLEKCGMKKL